MIDAVIYKRNCTGYTIKTVVAQKEDHLEEVDHIYSGHREGIHLDQEEDVLQEVPCGVHLVVLLVLVYKEDILDTLQVQVGPDIHILDILLEVVVDSCRVGDHIPQMEVHSLW